MDNSVPEEDAIGVSNDMMINSKFDNIPFF
jgi:hypothetical protein